MVRKKNKWLLYALITALFWGTWGALIEIPEKAGFPATLGYSVWAMTMIPIGAFAFYLVRGSLDKDRRSLIMGFSTGLLGCSGQLLLFLALRNGPAYLVFPFVSIAPVITILLSYWILKEKASRKAWAGIFMAITAIFFLSYQSPGNSPVSGYLWAFFALLVATMWGLQAFVLKSANITMRAESLIVYSSITAVITAPLAVWMTDFSLPINWSFKGPYLTAMIQLLNAVGFMTLVFAFRYGKAIIVSPMVNALPPVITIIISLLLYRVIPHPVNITGMVLAVASAFLLATEGES